MIFVTGDCHGNFERFKPKYFPEQAQMTKRDIVICAGDFGGVWFSSLQMCFCHKRWTLNAIYELACKNTFYRHQNTFYKYKNTFHGYKNTF